MATILIVDDLSTNRDVLVTLLRNQGHRVLEAADGGAGLVVAQAKHPDLVITDVLMPVMDGYEFIRQLRASGEHNSLPILILTTETSQDKRDQGRAAGGTGWIVKPFDPEKLITVIHRVVH